MFKLKEKILNEILSEYTLDTCTESHLEYRCSYSGKIKNSLSENNIRSLFLQLPNRDTFRIELEIDANYAITISSSNPQGISTALDTLSDYYGDEVNFNVTISKKCVDGRKSIIDITLYSTYLSEIDLSNNTQFISFLDEFVLVRVFESYIDISRMDFIDHSIVSCSENSAISTLISNKIPTSLSINGREYPFTFSSLRIDNYTNIKNTNILMLPSNDIQVLLVLLSQIYSLYILCIVSDIQEYNSNSGEFKFTYYSSGLHTLHIKSLSQFDTIIQSLFSVFNWVYSSESVTDKLAIAKNVIASRIVSSSHCNTITLTKIFENISDAMDSSHKIYLEKNFEKYINLKNTMIEQTISLNAKFKSTSDDFAKYIIGNAVAFLTLFIALFVTNSIYTAGSDYTKIFTDNMANLILVMLLGSSIMLLASIYKIKYDIKVFKQDFDFFIAQYRNIMNIDDIKQVFDTNQVNVKSKQTLHIVNVYSLAWATALFLIGIFFLTYAKNCISNTSFAVAFFFFTFTPFMVYDAIKEK